MKKTFAKAFALLTVLAITLSGCNLIEIDAKMQADEDIAKINEKYSKVVATYNGGEITAGEVIGDFNSYYNEMAYMYQYYFGTEITREDILSMAEEVLQGHVRSEIAAAKFDEAHTLSEEDIAAMEEEIQFNYEQNLASAMETAEGKTEEQKAENARVDLHAYGLGYDTFYTMVQETTKMAEMENILRAEVAEVSEEALMAAYEEKVAQQQEMYMDGRSFETAMGGSEEIVCWMPEGYRTVKHILVMLEDEIQYAYDDAAYALEAAANDLELLEDELAKAKDDDLEEGESTPEDIQAEIDAIRATIPEMEAVAEKAKQACLDAAKSVTDEIYAKLAAGESFEDLIAEYGEDPGMQNEPAMSRGYYVSENSQKWEVNFRDASMALANVGDYTMEPVISGSGVHIILYNSDVPAGNVDFAAVRDALESETLTAMQDAHCEETISAWIEAANPSYDVQALLDIAAGV